MPRPAQNEEQREVVRRRILVAAQELFDSAGIEAVSMRGLGAKVGLTASALYAYFPAKIDLLRAFWWDALDQMHARMEVLSREERDPIAAIRALGRAYVDFALENPARFRVVFMVDQGALAAEFRSAGVYHDSYRLFRQRVAEAIEQGRLRVTNPELAAQALWAGVHGTLTLPNSSASFPFEAPAKIADLVVEALLAGMAANPNERSQS
jgi:AcrR family transcriptional regulator